MLPTIIIKIKNVNPFVLIDFLIDPLTHLIIQQNLPIIYTFIIYFHFIKFMPQVILLSFGLPQIRVNIS